MSGSLALQKILFREKEDGDCRQRGYHFSGTYGSLLHSAWLEQPALVTPKSGYRFSLLCLMSSFLLCSTMKRTNKEKWWLGLFLMTCVYYSSMKAHKVNNGLVGHQSAFFAAGMGTIGSVSRLILGSGGRKSNVCLLGIFSSLMWYELGRFHLWSEYLVEYRRVTAPERSFDLLDEYIAPHCEVEFLPYRTIQ